MKRISSSGLGRIKSFIEDVIFKITHEHFCPGCNKYHSNWARLSSKPWFCLKCFDVRDEPISPWENYPRPL